MSRKDMALLNLLCEKVGITTAKELEEFKQQNNITTNDMLLRRLALYVAAEINVKDGDAYEYIYN